MAGQSFSVNSNFASMQAQKDLYFTNIGLNKTLGKLSSGKRIVDSSDDAAGLAIASSLNADAAALDQAVRNANDGIAVVQIADGALEKMGNLLLRSVTLAEQAASELVDDNEKATLDVEYQQLLSELNRVVSVTNFKGEALFSGAAAVTKSVYVGDTQISSTIRISVAAVGQTALGLSGSSITSTTNARTALTNLQGAIASISALRGSLGAQQNRFVNAVGIIQVQSLNIKAAASTIMDANMAEEIVNMTKYQILMQSGMSSLAQANASSQMVLQLLR